MKKSNFEFTTPYILNLSYIANDEYRGNSQIKYTNELVTYFKETDDVNSKIVGLNIKIGEKENKNLPFFLEMSIEAKFKWEKDAYNENVLQELLTKNAAVLLLSYARPIISFVTASGPFPSYDIPFCNFQE